MQKYMKYRPTFQFVAAIFAATLFLSGCATPPPPQPLAAFNEQEYAKFSGSGSGILEGQAFLRTRGGDIKYAAGSEVALKPATSHGRDWANRCYRTDRWHPVDDRARPYLRTAIADASGSFRFTNLPPGEYVVVTSIFWQYPRSTGSSVYMATTGGFVAGIATVEDGQVVRVILN